MKALIIGTGFGARVVAPIYQKVGIEVELVSPRDRQAVRRAIAAPVDLVSIHSPPFMHREHVLLALEQKRNVVCDKPFGKSAAEAREMLAAARDAGVLHFLNFEFRQEGVRKKAKELLEQNAIGAIKHINCTAMMSFSRHPLQNYRWLWNRELGGGWMNAFGSHIVDAFRDWIGEIETATGICRTEIPYRPDAAHNPVLCTAEDGFTACFTFKNGASGTLDASYAAAINRPLSIEIFGAEGAILLDTATKLELKRPGQADQHFDFPPWTGDIHAPAFTQWAAILRDAVRENRQIAPSFKDGLACAEIMENFRNNATWLSQA